MVMNQLLRFSGSVKRDPAIETWMKAHTGDLGLIAQHWFEVMRKWETMCENCCMMAIRRRV